MGWAVGYDREHGRWRGYGVPAYCDAKGCSAEIDRGFGYTCEGLACQRANEDGELVGCIDIDELEKNLFVCGEHTCADVDEDDLPPEHPDWAAHLLTDQSWQQWRDENPEKVAALSPAPAESCS